jgi:hypothetical protein
MSAESWVVRLMQDGTDGTPPILINVSRKEGGNESDFDLLATDGEAAYIAKGEGNCAICLKAT